MGGGGGAGCGSTRSMYADIHYVCMLQARLCVHMSSCVRFLNNINQFVSLMKTGI